MYLCDNRNIDCSERSVAVCVFLQLSGPMAGTTFLAILRLFDLHIGPDAADVVRAIAADLTFATLRRCAAARQGDCHPPRNIRRSTSLHT
jgi:hypothetical protein